MNANPIIAVGGNVLDSRYYTGLIEEVKIFDVALTEQEIQQVSVPTASPTIPPIGVSPVDAVDTFYWLINAGADSIKGKAIYGLNPDGSTTVLYAPEGLPQDAWIGSMDIDSQGRVIFEVIGNNGSYGLYWGHINTKELFKISDHYLDIPGLPCWIPGKDEILFSNMWSGIHRIDLDPTTNDEKVLTSNYFDEISGITNDGKVIFWNSMYRMPGRLFSMNLDGTGIHELNPFDDHRGEGGIISPDNQYMTLSHRQSSGEGGPRLWLGTIDGMLSPSTPLDNPLVDWALYHEDRGRAAWSPDSKTIAFWFNNELWSVNIDRTDLHQVTRDHQFTGGGVWTFTSSTQLSQETTMIVWPGYTDNNGLVDERDVLTIGMYWAKTGPARTPASATWNGYPAQMWTPSAATYADANGDGIVDERDILPIGMNWHKTHEIPKGAPVIDIASINHSQYLNAYRVLLAALGSNMPDNDATARIKTLLQQVIALGESQIIPKANRLLSNYPNPFNPETWIPFELANDSDVTIRIYDVNGRLIRTLNLGNLPAGLYRSKHRAVYWNGKTETGEQVASGMYFYTIHAGNFQATKKMCIIR